MKLKLFSLFILLIFNACEISLDGNTFYVVEGKLLDTLNQPVQNHHLQVLTSQGDLFMPHEKIIINECNTHENGYFKINFPASNRDIYLTFEPNYFKYDSVSDTGRYYGTNYEIQLSPNNSINNRFDLGNVHIKKGWN